MLPLGAQAQINWAGQREGICFRAYFYINRVRYFLMTVSWFF